MLRYLFRLYAASGYRRMLAVSYTHLKRPGWFGDVNALGVTSRGVSLFLKKIQLLADELKEWQRQQSCVIITVGSRERGLRLRDGLRDMAVSYTHLRLLL